MAYIARTGFSMNIHPPLLHLPIRLRRNRRSQAIRTLLQETHLLASDLIAPIFLIDGHQKKKEEITAMPGVFRLSIDLALKKAAFWHQKGIEAIALFPSIPREKKTEQGEEAWNPEGLIPTAIRRFKQEIPSLCIIADIALDPYTSHGHDGVVDENQQVLNDETIHCLIKMTLVLAEAGADIVAPSDMMDGRVKALRSALDNAEYTKVGILAYSAKYASSLYTPFREALQSQLLFGNKKSYQMNPANQREALLEASLDEQEGADILMVKPALFYLDVISKLRDQTNRPIAAYHVSGEYAMVMAAHSKGWLDANSIFYEALLSIKRAGADLIFSYAFESTLSII